MQRNKKILENRKAEKKDKSGRKAEDNIEKKKRNTEKKKETVCPYLKKGRCHYGLSGRKHNKNREGHTEKECREGKLCECPFNHPLVCGKLLRKGIGRYGCKDEKVCNKLHPKICSNSLRGVCHVFECQLGIHIQGTNTKEAREKDKKERDEERQESRRKGGAEALNPSLPDSQQPQNLQQVLGQQREKIPPRTPPAQAPAQLGQLGQTGLNQETASFLGQLLLGELLRRMNQDTPSLPTGVETRQEGRQVPALNLEALLRGLTLPQQN